LVELILLPTGEWMPAGRCWTIVRVAGGFGYCLNGGSAREIKTGDMMITGPSPGVTLRASQLAELRLAYFRVVPQRLNGLITVMEWRQLERIPTQGTPRVFYFAANEAPAQKFARLAAQPQREDLSMRSSLLQLWAACVANVLPSLDDATVHKTNLEATFRRFISKISEKELATSSMADLAAQLNCSERHLSRLFRMEFGMSLREHQTELGLQRACQMLQDPDVKIRNVAYETGYRHVGFFNALFKKRFGMTPKEWREQNLSAPNAGTLKIGTALPGPKGGPAGRAGRGNNGPASLSPTSVGGNGNAASAAGAAPKKHLSAETKTGAAAGPNMPDSDTIHFLGNGAHPAAVPDIRLGLH
jgi:AraC-like DNA-binding protein